jgi:uncharacterized protein YktB (UPF0637 family)
MNKVDASFLERLDENLRSVFFEEIFEEVNYNQYKIVNKLVPALIAVEEGIPDQDCTAYFKILLDHTRSNSWEGKPAAKRALANLSERIKNIILSELTPKEMLRIMSSYWQEFDIINFVINNEKCARSDTLEMAQDKKKLSRDKFWEKYPDD